MDTESQGPVPPSTQLSALSVRLLVKVFLKSALWLTLAWLVVYFFPEATWPWYVALSLVAIGVLFSLYVLITAIFAKRRESITGQHGGG
jgi:putative flippase GtrA